MTPERLPVDAWLQQQRDPVAGGHARAIYRGPRSVEQVLDAARTAMDEQDDAEAYRRDPIAYMAAQRRRSTLWSRLFGR